MKGGDTNVGTDNFKAELDPLEELYGDLEKLVKSSVIKYSYKAEEYESFEKRLYVDQYLDALQKTDKFENYKYTADELIAVGIQDPLLIQRYLANRASIPGEETRKNLLENRRKMIIETYVEPNEYYRVLNGLPPLSLELPEITTSTVVNSFLVVADEEAFDNTRGDFNQIVSLTTAKKIMNSLSIVPGMYIYLTEFEMIFNNSLFQPDNNDPLFTFRVVPDITPIEFSDNYIYATDAYRLGLKLFPDEFYTLDGNYVKKDDVYIYPSALGDILKVNEDMNRFGRIVIRVRQGHYYNVTKTVQSSLKVVPNDEVITDETYNSKIHYDDAKLNNPNCIIGDYMILKNFIYPSKEFEDIYGVSSRCPLHRIADKYGNRYIGILEASGLIDQIVKENPNDKYLEFIGSKRIPIIDARKAKNFELIYFDASNTKEFTAKMFATLYSGARDYFVNCVYNQYYRPIYDYYDNFIALAIMQMAIQQVIARTAEGCIARDFYDVRMIQWLFESYGIPFSSRLSYRTQVNLCKNLNMLIMNKGSNKVLYDIASLLGYHDVQIYKYYLMKSRQDDVTGHPLYIYKTVTEPYTDPNGEIIDGPHEVHDLEKEYDVYFQKVELKDINYEKSLVDSTNRENFNQIVEEDPLWWETNKDTWDAVYGDPTIYLSGKDEEDALRKHYNYTETKYLGVTISYKLSEVLYENILLLRMLFDMKNSINDITVTFPNLTGSMEVSLFDAVTFLCALMCRQYRVSGNILTDPSKLLHVCEWYDMKEYCDEYNANETTGVNPHKDPDARENHRVEVLRYCFEKVTNEETFKELIKDPSRYLKPDEIDKFFSYFEILTLPEGDTQEKITAFNKMFENVRSLGYFIADKMEESKNAKEYHAWKSLYNSLFIGKENSEMFSMGSEDNVAKTYLEYLQTMNPSLYNLIAEVDNDNDFILYNYIDHVIYQLEKVTKDLSSMYLRNDANSSVLKYFMKLLKFFKSYTVDILDLSIQYVFDLKPDNLFKLAEDYMIHKTDEIHDPLKLMYGDFCRIIAIRKETEPLLFEEFIAMHKDLGTISTGFTERYDTIDLYKHYWLFDNDFKPWDTVQEILAHMWLEDSFHLSEDQIYHGKYRSDKEDNLILLSDEMRAKYKKTFTDETGFYDTVSKNQNLVSNDKKQFKDLVFINPVEVD